MANNSSLDDRNCGLGRDIAIVGLACRFPNSPSVQAFWQTLLGQVNAVKEIPSSRWDVAAYYQAGASAPGKMNSKWAGLIEDIDQFDAEFFRISAREAKSMDPQQRLLLEVTWEALEHAGISQDSLEGTRTGVFVGICASEYSLVNGNHEQAGLVDKYFGTGTALSVAAGRISYVMNWHGPALSIETACSSSLVAVHQAVRSLRDGESDVCVAGGVNIVLSPAVGVYFSQLGAVSGSPRCKAFDRDADGYVRGEGCGMVALKRLSDAQRDGDHVLAVIKGSAVNHDGRSAGLTAPNGNAQESVLRAALRDAQVNAEEVGLIEAHGTGTRLGDPIEATAIGRVYGQSRPANDPVLIGSVKTNLGHLEAAAGIAGLIKIALAVNHSHVPPQANWRHPNPLIPWEELNLAVASTNQPWPHGKPPIAAVSSFGFSGTNAHVVLGAHAAASSSDAAAPGIFCLPLSARSAGALNEVMNRCHEQLRGLEPGDLAALGAVGRGWSLRRSHHAWRRCFIGRNAAQLMQSLENTAAAAVPGSHARTRTSVTFVFSGQGSQWPAMATACLNDDAAAAVLEDIHSCVLEMAPWSLLDELREGRALAREDVEITQVCVYAMQVALARRWQAYGIEPTTVVGHSMGEIAAAHIAGILDLRQATHLSVARSRLLARVAGRGLMVMAELAPDEATGFIRPWNNRVSIAAFNGFSSTILSGELAAMQEITDALERAAIGYRRLRTGGVAGHSAGITHLGDELATELKNLTPRDADIAFISGVAGQPLAGRYLNAEYWRRNLLEPVRFSDCVAHLCRQSNEVFIEVSPKPVLLPSVQQICATLDSRCVNLASLQPNIDLEETTARGLARLYELGLNPNWRRIYPGQGRWQAPPPYPWQRRRHWITDLLSEAAGAAPAGPQLGTPNHDLEAQFQACVAHWDNYGVNSVNMPNLAPHRLVTPDVQAAFLLGIRDSVCIAWAYLGSPDHLARHSAWLLDECRRNSLGFAMLADDDGAPLAMPDLDATEVGFAHRIELAAFDLGGSKMRRLRGQVQRYRREHQGRTHEYQPGSDASIDRQLIALIDRWQALKGRAVLAAADIKRNIVEGRAIGASKLFITGTEVSTHSAVLLTPFGNGQGFLLDMEFYGEDAPPGCNEFAIVSIIEQLAAVGCRTLSLGGSYDPAATSGQKNNNIQFKRKFAPRQNRILLYRRRGEPVLDALLHQLAAPQASAESAARGSLAECLRHPPMSTGLAATGDAAFGIKRVPIAGDTFFFECVLRRDLGLIAQHCVYGTPVAPGALFVSLTQTALAHARPGIPWCIDDLVLMEPLMFTDSRAARVQLQLTPRESAAMDFSIAATFDAHDNARWRQHVSGRARADVPRPRLSVPASTQWQNLDPRRFYTELVEVGIEHGPAYQVIRRMRFCQDWVEAELEFDPGAGAVTAEWVRNPVLIDAALQILAAAVGRPEGGAVLLQSVGFIAFGAGAPERCIARAHRTADPLAEASPYTGDVDVLSTNGELLLSLRDVLARPLAASRSPARSAAQAPAPSLFRYQWVPRIPAAPASARSGWLLLGSDRALLEALRANLLATGVEPMMLLARDRTAGFQELQNLQPAIWDGIDKLILLPDAVEPPIEQQQKTAGACIVELIQALRKRSAGTGLDTVLVTRAVSQPSPAHLSVRDAALCGAVRVLAVEHAEWPVQLIDLDFAVPNERGAKAIVAIASAGDGNQWRVSADDTRILRLASHALPDSSWRPRQDAAYLVTGWSGGIGLQVAQWLMEQGARHLVLLARGDGAGAARDHIDAVAQRCGGICDFHAVDVSEAEALVRVCEPLQARGTPIRGVFHAAGEVLDGYSVKQTAQDFERNLAAKLGGTWNLHQATRGFTLDVFVLFSSAATLFAPPSQGAHAAASAAMDYLARWRHAQGLPAQTLGWGQWGQVGKAAKLEIGDQLSGFGILRIATGDAIEALSRAVNSESCQLFIASVDWSVWRKRGGIAASWPLFETFNGPRADPPGAGSRRPAPREVDEPAVRERIVRSAAETLMARVEDIDMGRSLEENGMDSIMMVELRDRLGREFGAPLPLVDFFRERSIASLAQRACWHLRQGAA